MVIIIHANSLICKIHGMYIKKVCRLFYKLPYLVTRFFLGNQLHFFLFDFVFNFCAVLFPIAFLRNWCCDRTFTAKVS